jgi:hypothetical protein
MMIKKCKPIPPRLFIIALFLAAALLTGTANAYWQSVPFTTVIQLDAMTYSYDPSTETLTKSYTFTNVSALTLLTPRLVNLFLWSNNICSTSYVTMGYDGSSSYSNLDQAAIANNDGLINWNQDATPPLSSAVVFPALPVQSTQSNVSYPYVNIPVANPNPGWAPGEQVTVNVTFTGVQNCNWIQNMVYVVYDTGGGGNPTVIVLSQFQALPGDGTVTLMWTTESEIDTAGFNIYRGKVGLGKSGRVKSDSVEMDKINATLIPAKGSNTSGAEYSYTDDDVKNGFTYIYKLEDVDINGVATEHGPITATPRWIHSLFHH